MPFQVSPGVNVSEVDLTTVIPAVSTSVGAFAGEFKWGPLLKSFLMTSADDLVEMFGKPDENITADFTAAANFLSYTSALRVVRAAATGLLNAADGSGGAELIENDDYWDGMGELGVNANTFYAKYAGARGNEIIVEVCDHSAQFENWASNSYFSAAPNTSSYASDRGATKDEVHVIVLNASKDGFTDTANDVLEVYPFLSKASDAKDDSNESSYFKTVINDNSKYIRVGTPANINSTYGVAVSDGYEYGNGASLTSVQLSGGADGTLAVGDLQTAWDIFADTEQEDVSLLITGAGGATLSEANQNTVKGYVVDLATTRKDCVAFISPGKDDVVNASSESVKLDNLTNRVTGFRNQTSGGVNKNTSYAFMDTGWKYQFDRYTKKYQWVPLNGDVAGLVARTDQERDAWFSPAGYNRGQIKNVTKLAYNPSKTHRDSLYLQQYNPVVSFPGQGTILFGDKTLHTRPSAFDRINVRRLFIVLEKAISTAAKFSLFEFNDAFTRAMFRNMVEPFLRDVKGRRGITDFIVVCDETNNPGSVIDRNEFVGDIYIKPTRSINFIQLNFVAVATGVEFSEVVGNF